MIAAPYNFVPLNKEVFYPSWSDKVSLDVPFSDGESGEIEIKITAHSPIFVRDSKDETIFCNHNSKEYIPATTVKGTIRTILDILSYSKLQLSDKVLSYRDLNHPLYKKKAMNGDKIHMGWLRKVDKKWVVDDLGTVTSSNSRIKYKEMYDYLDEETIKDVQFKRESFEKYKAVGDRSKLDTDIGTIVFTGKVGAKKTREFLFPKNIKKRLIISKKVIDTFKQAYYIGKVDENKNWKNLWSKELKKGNKIPVFFQLDAKGEIQHFGLSMLYKLPYENSILDLLKSYQNYDENRADLSETIFGYTNKDRALKGRVQFSHFHIQNKVEINKKVTLPLSSPRATFFPSYLEQNHSGDYKTKHYKTYDDKNAVLRGFKFYPIQTEATFSEHICKDHPKVCTTFYPLGKGSTFIGKVRFFNLKKSELGALVASINYLGNDNSYHKIGMAKPFGFGTVNLSLGDIKTVEGKTISYSEIVEEFALELRKELDIDIYNDDRIKALWTLSENKIDDKVLKYISIKDFVFAKKPINRHVLPKASELLNYKVKKEDKKTDINKSSYNHNKKQNNTIRNNKNNTKPKNYTQPKKQTVAQNQQPIGISKNKIKKSLKSYWDENFGIFYHQNQINEFFSADGFKTTPKEQVLVYENNRANQEFITLLKVVQRFNDNKLNEKEKEALYKKLTEKSVEKV